MLERGCVRAGAVVAIAVMVGVAVGTPAGAQTGERSRRDRRISISGGVVIAQDEAVNGPVVSVDGPAVINGVVTDKVYVGRGDARINGRVTGDVLVVDGDATVNGRVGGDVIAVSGRVTVHSGARVSGDVVSRRDPHVASGTVAGKVRHFNLSSIFRGFLIAFLLFSWLAVTFSVAILGFLFVLLFPRAADATVAAGRRVWPSLGWGALVGIVGPILGLLVLVTIVGIPLGLGVFAALGVLSPLGYVVASLSLGRTMVKGTSTGGRIGAFFAGFLNQGTIYYEQSYLVRQTERSAIGFASYPLSRVQRLEFSAGYENISFNTEIQTLYFDAATFQFLGKADSTAPSRSALNLGIASAALNRPNKKGPALPNSLRAPDQAASMRATSASTSSVSSRFLTGRRKLVGQ